MILLAVALVCGAGAIWWAPNNEPNDLPAGWVVKENQRRGTRSWRIAQRAFGGVEGYTNRVSARRGDSVTLYVSTTAPVFHVEAYRMGWYQGLGGRLVWQSGDIPGTAQPRPTLITATRTITTTWRASMRVHVSNDWMPGDYLLKLVSSRGQSYVPLTVRTDGSRAAVLVVNAVTTWQAYNDWGGYSLYFGPNQDTKRRSTVVSFDRPYDWAIRSGIDPSAYVVCCGFVGTELGVVTLVERLGLDVAYTTDVDLEERPQQLLEHKVIVSAGHDEYWSVARRNAVEAARDKGVNLMFLGPNAAFWRIRLEASRLGKNRHEVNYRVARDDPLFGRDDSQVTTLWRSPPGRPRPESALTGMVFFCFAPDSDGVVADASSWVFAGTGLNKGDHIPRLVQREADHVDTRYETPANVETLLHSPVTCAGLGGKRVGLDGRLFSDTTYYTTPSGSGVFAAGSEWNCRLYDGCPDGPRGADPVVRRIVENVLRAFVAGPAGRAHPSSGGRTQAPSP